MSPPDTNTKKQYRRHRPVLIGLVAVVLFAGLMWWAMAFETTEGDLPDEPQATPQELGPTGGEETDDTIEAEDLPPATTGD